MENSQTINRHPNDLPENMINFDVFGYSAN